MQLGGKLRCARSPRMAVFIYQNVVKERFEVQILPVHGSFSVSIGKYQSRYSSRNFIDQNMLLMVSRQFNMYEKGLQIINNLDRSTMQLKIKCNGNYH